jgi:hypothetical protein
MMPVIRISEATWERLKGYARPLEDSAEDVVRRALDALDAMKGTTTSAVQVPTPVVRPTNRNATVSESRKLPQREFREPLLAVLRELGGKASVKDIRELLERKIAHRLNDADHRNVSSGDPRWWNATCWERNGLVKEGVLRDDSERGVWELTDHGKTTTISTSSDSLAATWRDDLEAVLALIDFGEGAALADIYREVRRVRAKAGRSVPENLEATVRRTLEDNSSDSDNYRGINIFYMPKGKGAGVWGLRSKRKR